ncbi:MAG: ATP-dependent DNA helicase RecG [Candidatus Omnitrophica bacterium]|nr:ATP-dependent DNA helicase RecG [Candidatus Omnitrophota bacterium]
MASIAGTSIQYLKGVGPARAKLFASLGVQTIEDLLYLFPRRYEDRSKLTPLSGLKPGEWHTASGEILSKGGRRVFFNKKHVFEVEIGDGDARVQCVWFNQPYLDNYFHVGEKVVVHGRVDVFKNRIQIIAPEYEIISKEDEHLSMGRIVPLYPLTKGMGQRYLRKLVASALEHYGQALVDVIPPKVLERQKLKPISQSIAQLHFPDSEAAQEEANKRISFEEFFFFQVCVILRRMTLGFQKGVSHKIFPDMEKRFSKIFPFVLTRSQVKVIAEIKADMMNKRPMLRLLQGDVGCGKTVVAFFGCLVAITNGKQSAVMAPTEILAEQHFQTFLKYFAKSPFGNVRVALLNSTLKKKDRDALYEAIKNGEVDIVFGTHALIQEGVTFKALSYVVIDEQHKFGVKQRALLSSKGKNPDVLVMTATPIPRSLCLTLYGDLDVSIIEDKPKGRGEIKTYHFVGEQADGVYKRVAEWVVEKKTQAYIVYPIIEESEKLDLKAATDMYAHFQKSEFKKLRVGLVHGRLPREEARQVMEKFQNHEFDILVTTTVLEVGIDVPNANVMVIEHAERFGLSQLHQLRGRIGRSEKNAICILLGDPQTEEGKKRIEAVVKTGNGFKISEEDLKIRGPGQYFGRHQHGLNELKVVNPLTQMDVLEAARKEAVALVNADPQLTTHHLIRTTIHKRYPEYLERVLAG